MSARSSARSAAVLALAAVLICGGPSSRAEQAAAEKPAEATSPEMAIRQVLAKPVDLAFTETPLADVAKSLERTLGVPVRLDRKPLDDVGISGDRPITFQVSSISARSALDLLLRPLDLTWVIAHEMLLITTPEERIRDALNKPIRLESSKTPLAEVVQSLREKAGVQIIIDGKALRDMVRGTGTPVTVHADDIKLRSVLDSMLKELDLTWTVACQVLLITTPEEAETMLFAKVYDVSDVAAYRNEQGEREPNQESLLSRIPARVYPESWDVVGGPGSIAPFDAAGIQVLVVSQTWKIHEEIESLLDKRRK